MANFNTGLNAEQLMKALNAVQTINNEEPDENHNIDINVVAADVNYNNTDSNLEAENVQDAIDELANEAENAQDAIDELVNEVSGINEVLGSGVIV